MTHHPVAVDRRKRGLVLRYRGHAPVEVPGGGAVVVLLCIASLFFFERTRISLGGAP
jgi:hypothetical protein